MKIRAALSVTIFNICTNEYCLCRFMFSLTYNKTLKEEGEKWQFIQLPNLITQRATWA
jgi:hypothetical protein